MSATFTGANLALAQLKKLQVFSPDEFGNALFQEAKIEEREIKERTPVKTGALRGSIKLSGPHRRGRRIWVVVEAGGPSAPYGFFVHEDLEAFHSQGEAKFISGPLRESSRFMADRIAKRITFNKALG